MRSFIFIVSLPLLTWAVVDPEKLKKLSMSTKDVKKMEQMHYGWYVQATSSLLGAMGKELYMKMNRNNRKAFVACMDRIEKEHDLQMGAQCLVKAFDGKLLESFPEVVYSPQFDFVGKDMPETRQEKKKRRRKSIKKRIQKKLRAKVVEEIGKDQKIRRKAAKKSKKSRSRKLRRSETGMPKRIRFGQGDATKSKEENQMADLFTNFENQQMRRRLKRNILSLYANEEMKEEAKRVDRVNAMSPFGNRIKTMDRTPELLEKKIKTPVKMVTDMIGGAVRKMTNTTEIDRKTLKTSFQRLKDLQEEVKTNNRNGQFKFRMLDMVLGEKHPLRKKKTFSERFRDIAPDMGLLDKEVGDLVDTVEKHTKNTNYNMLSPRFLPILPDKYAGTGMKGSMLSPNLFPLYKDDSGNSILPIPDVLEKTGMVKDDQDAILELLMDATGVNDAVTSALDAVRNLKAEGLDMDVVGITQMMDNAFASLEQSMNKNQKKDIKNRKYSFLEKWQLEKLLGAEGFLNTTLYDSPFDLEAYGELTHEQREEALRTTVRKLADGTLGEDPETKHTRAKRFTIKLGDYSINHYQHITLSPYAFSPTINTLNVLGPVTLSPSLFSPNIISPLLLSPPIISPQVGNPLIFSPYVLGPNVLSAAVFNAYVFSPYVLSPNVINPYVLSPLILSPYVLCPDVLSPTVLSGVVLSPSVLSPSVFTESALAANVLSPTFLS